MLPAQRPSINWVYNMPSLSLLTCPFFIGPLRTNISEIVIAIYTFLFRKTHLKTSFGKWQPFCIGLNVLIFSVFQHLWRWKRPATAYSSLQRDDSLQSWFYACAQSMRDGVTLSRRLSLAGHKPRISPALYTVVCHWPIDIDDVLLHGY